MCGQGDRLEERREKKTAYAVHDGRPIDEKEEKTEHNKSLYKQFDAGTWDMGVPMYLLPK